MEIREVKRKIYIDKCKLCNKEIRGTSPEHTVWLMNVHKMAYHENREKEDDNKSN